mmetsp:Transcript_112935/g.258627  ORF Transcript_112935/g.258627 Transcript_112935/m.258627 type:complete len:612 (+) Transcript_112935:28-1863(+)
MAPGARRRRPGPGPGPKKAKKKVGDEDSDGLSDVSSEPEAPEAVTKEPAEAEERGSMGTCCVILVVILFVATFALRILEERHNVGDLVRQEEDLYEALEVVSDAAPSEIKRAYRRLALMYHPDKVRNCDHCGEKFRKVSQAYETLSDPDKRKVYDLSGGSYESLRSAASVRLTAQNYQGMVLQSRDVWVIQTFSEVQDASRRAAAHWEQFAADMKKVARFGRIDANLDNDALRLLPISVRLHPTILMVAKGHPVEILPLGDLTVGGMKKWLNKNYPIVAESLWDGGVSEWLERWQHKARLLVVTSSQDQSTMLRALLLKLSSIYQVAYTSAAAATEAGLGKQVESATAGAVLAISFAPLSTKVHGSAQLIKKTPFEKAWATLSELHYKLEPVLTRDNFMTLCKSNEQNRVFCLAAANISQPCDGDCLSVQAVQKALVESTKGYAQFRQTASDSDLPPVRIQVVTWSVDQGSSTPWASAAPAAEFWAQNVSHTPLFVLDCDTSRLAKLGKAGDGASDWVGKLNHLHEDLHDDLLSFASISGELAALLPTGDEGWGAVWARTSWSALLGTGTAVAGLVVGIQLLSATSILVALFVMSSVLGTVAAVFPGLLPT